jgi:hypothetical protein
VKLMRYLAFTDRLSNYGVDLGDNTTFKTLSTGGGPLTLYDQGMSKLRMAGKINVNTASPEVLATIPVLRANPQLIGVIMAYRWRTNTADVRIPPAYQYTPAIDFSPVAANGAQVNNLTGAEVPGYGIRSLHELLIPIWAYQLAKATTAGTTYLAAFPTMADRDVMWGDLYNALTVRSDTFVVYAYLEAVRQNPKYAGPFDNKFVWYGTGPAVVTDNPDDAARPLLRVARKRWVAIVDRSECNYSRYLPFPVMGMPMLDPRFSDARIVAEKDLPR